MNVCCSIPRTSNAVHNGPLLDLSQLKALERPQDHPLPKDVSYAGRVLAETLTSPLSPLDCHRVPSGAFAWYLWICSKHAGLEAHYMVERDEE